MRSGERPDVSRLPLVGALTGALSTIKQSLSQYLLPAQGVPAETCRGAKRDEERVQAAIYYYRSGKVHVSRRTK